MLVLLLELEPEVNDEEELLPLPLPPPREVWHTTHSEEAAKLSLYPQLPQCQEFEASVVVVRSVPDPGDGDGLVGVRFEKSLG